MNHHPHPPHARAEKRLSLSKKWTKEARKKKAFHESARGNITHNCLSIIFSHWKFPIWTQKIKERPNSFFIRAIFEWNEARSIFKSLNELDIEVIILTIPSMFLLFSASLSKCKNMHLDVRDLTWEYLSSKKTLKLWFSVLSSASTITHMVVKDHRCAPQLPNLSHVHIFNKSRI